MSATRRSLLTGLGGIILAGTAIVRASSLMTVKALDPLDPSAWRVTGPEGVFIVDDPFLLENGYGALNPDYVKKWFACVLNSQMDRHSGSKPVVILSRIHA